MPAFCAVYGCTNKQSRQKEKKYYRFPVIRKTVNKELKALSQERLKKWIHALARKDFTLEHPHKLSYSRICSDHFISGKPAELENVNSPDWVPSVNMKGGKKVSLSPLKRKRERHERHLKRKAVDSTTLHLSQPPEEKTEENLVASDEPPNFEKEVLIRNTELHDLRKQIHLITLDEAGFQGNDSKVLYYTGLPNFEVFTMLLRFVSPWFKEHTILNYFQQLLLTLMKLRLNLDFSDLGYRFGVSRQSISRYYSSCLSVLYFRLKNFIKVPDRAIIKKTMPQCFQQSFGKKVCLLIDCFEVFIEKPSKLKTAAACWSNYKHHYTIKYLIGITPQGTVAFISEAWGGRSSDKHITLHSKFLDFLEPGDFVMADRGFLIEESVNSRFAEVILPAFTKGKKQLSPLDLERTRNIANVRIHVERVIGTIRQKYSILHSVIPISTISNEIDGIPEVDMIVTVACALINLCPSVVPLN